MEQNKKKIEKQKTFYYWVKPHPTDFNLCPICDSKLIMMDAEPRGECSNKKCNYFDGVIKLTEKQAEVLKDKLIKTIDCPF